MGMGWAIVAAIYGWAAVLLTLWGLWHIVRDPEERKDWTAWASIAGCLGFVALCGRVILDWWVA